MFNCQIIQICSHIFVHFICSHSNMNVLLYSLKGVDDMAVSQKQLGYAKKYLSTLDEIRIRIPKGKKEEYKSAAEAYGKSLNQFVIDCIEKALE